MQQHSYPSHSKHFVFPVSGLTIEEMVDEAAEPGPLRLTRVLLLEVHILDSGLLGENVSNFANRVREGKWD